jgi:hypothetical protein
MHATMADMGLHSAPLRLAETPDRITVLAGAMRAFADRPASPDTRRDLDTAMLGCTGEEYEEAWELARPEQVTGPGTQPGGPAVTPAHPVPGALTTGQKVLAGFAAVLGLGLTPMFFIVMFMTVNELLGPYFSGWAWTVPVATETTFVLLTVLAILFEWMRRPVPSLWRLPYLFAGLSVFLNVWADRASPAGIAGHLAVTAAFFIPMSFAKTTVRKLIITSAERARAQSLADARAHAQDVLRAAFGVFWRVRTPALLRRQLKSSRLPAAVMAAVDTTDAAVWEPVVQAWITAAVTLPAQVGRTLRAAAAVTAEDTGQDNAPDNSGDNGRDNPAAIRGDSAPDNLADNRSDNALDNSPDTVTDISPDRRGTVTGSRTAKATAPADPVAVMIRRRPKWDDDKIAEECGVHPRTVKRRRASMGLAPQGASATA